MNMEETVKAFGNPSWWILTVAVGFLLNILAPFVNKGIESFWGSRSKRKSDELKRTEDLLQRRVARLADRPNGLIEAKLEVIYWAIRIVLTLTIYLLIVQVVFSIPLEYFNAAAAPAALAGFFHIARYWKSWISSRRIHNLLRKLLNERERCEASLPESPADDFSPPEF